MDIVVKGRRTDVAERFRNHATEKLAKVGKLDQKVIRIDVEVSKERNPRLADLSDRVEITCRSRGPIIRAEAAATDPYAALDLAMDKLESRLRRAADRRRVHHGSRTPLSVSAATAPTADVLTQRSYDEVDEAGERYEPGGPGASALEPSEGSEDGRVIPMDMDGDGPLVVREKVHKAVPMTLDQALLEMELVGHDFYLFIDRDTGGPSVVYRRKGYDYGVIRLEA